MSPEFSNIETRIISQEQYPGRVACLTSAAEEIIRHSMGARCIGGSRAQELVDATNIILNGGHIGDVSIADSVINALKHSSIDDIDEDPEATYVLSALSFSHVHGIGRPNEKETDRVERFVEANGYWVSIIKNQLQKGVHPSDIEQSCLEELSKDVIKKQGYPEIVQIASDRSFFIYNNLINICMIINNSLEIPGKDRDRYAWLDRI